MNTQTKILFTLLFCTLLISCSSSTNSENNNSDEEAPEEKTPETTNKDLSELTYRDVVDLVFKDQGEGVEWHGEEMPNTLISLISIGNEGDCGEGDCGKSMYISNTDSTKSIEVIMKGAYDLEGDIGYIARKYILSPGEKLSIGCSHLCYDGKSYLFDRKIVGSAYIELN
jgi:hypothetical protein